MLLPEQEAQYLEGDGNGCLVKQPLTVSQHALDQDSSFWFQETSAILQKLLSQAAYTIEKQKDALAFYKVLAKNLGRRPTDDGQPRGWYSFMTDDFSPLEFSWHWGSNISVADPTIRFSMEPIGRDAGSVADPYNATATMDLIDQIRCRVPDLDLQLFHHFVDKLIVGPLPSMEMNDTSKASIEMRGHKSTVFLAFEFVDNGPKLKAYFMPLITAIRASTTITDLLDQAIGSLGVKFDQMPALTKLVQFLRVDAPIQELSPLMVAVDCVDPSKARLKVYARTPRTSFSSVLTVMNMFEDFKHTPSADTDLKCLWQAILSLEENFDSDAELPTSSHKTSGILYYFEVDAASPSITPKLYIPVKHYGRSDQEVALGLEKFLENRGWYRQQGWTKNFQQALQEICTYRSLDGQTGLQTYISCGIKANRLDITSYISPQMYHPGRWGVETG